VGATAAIAGAVFIRVIILYEFTLPFMILAFLVTALITVIVVGGFNGTLVSVFKIQPMVATLIMFTTGRAIAYWINGGSTPTIFGNDWLDYFGRFIPGVPIHTPIITAVVCVAIVFLVLKFTNLGLYIQSVGINEKSARLNGINPVAVKYMAFAILGLCVTIAAVTTIGRIGLMNHVYILQAVELDAILAVAIGGNSLGGGKFKLSGSIMGAYVIYGLTETLFNAGVSSTVIQAYKAVVIIFLVILSSPVVQEKMSQTWKTLMAKRAASAQGEGQ
jgi:simple sugar transport system permease protein